LFSIGECRVLTESGADLVARLSMDDDLDVDVEPIELTLNVPGH